MRKILVALALTTTAASAQAQDWSGVYVGAFGGTAGTRHAYNLNNANASGAALNQDDVAVADFLVQAQRQRSTDPFESGAPFLGGIIGYDWQTGPWVFGGFADIAKTDVDTQLYSDIFGTQARYHLGVNYLGSVQARAGYAFDRALLYVHGGYAFAGTEIDLDINAMRHVDRSNFNHGYTVGVGGEYALANGLSLTAGYAFSRLGPDAVISGQFTEQNTVTPIRLDEELKIHQLRFGINYRPGMAEAQPSAQTWTPSWSGFYVGGYAGLGVSTLGYALNSQPNVGPDTITDPTQLALLNLTLNGGLNGDAKMSAHGVSWGAQVGYDRQFGSVVAGAFADITRVGFEYDFNLYDNFSGAGDYIASLDYVGTVQGRLGYAFDRALLFVHGGYAFGRRSIDIDSQPRRADISDRQYKHGFVVGAGAELALSERLSLVSDYSFTKFSDDRIVEGRLFDRNFTMDESARFHQVRIGLNYRFGG